MTFSIEAKSVQIKDRQRIQKIRSIAIKSGALTFANNKSPPFYGEAEGSSCRGQETSCFSEIKAINLGMLDGSPVVIESNKGTI